MATKRFSEWRKRWLPSLPLADVNAFVSASQSWSMPSTATTRRPRAFIWARSCATSERVGVVFEKSMMIGRLVNIHERPIQPSSAVSQASNGVFGESTRPTKERPSKRNDDPMRASTLTTTHPFLQPSASSPDSG